YRMFDFPNAPREESLKQIDECLETAAFFGAKHVLAIPGFVHDSEDRMSVCERMCALLTRMCERAKTYGIIVSLEDFDDRSAPYSTISGLEYFLKNVEGLGFTFDTGNFAYSLESAAEAYSRLQKYVSHVHLKDRSWDASRSNPDGSNAKADLSGRVMYPSEVGGGFIGIAQLLETLKKNGYSGSYSIEHFGAVNQLEYMKSSAEFVRSVLSE
ncbi:MAG: sugar phosphate isomerase/epimerase family protein, partial [Oscillospiraceae bacterium]